MTATTLVGLDIGSASIRAVEATLGQGPARHRQLRPGRPVARHRGRRRRQGPPRGHQRAAPDVGGPQLQHPGRRARRHPPAGGRARDGDRQPAAERTAPGAAVPGARRTAAAGRPGDPRLLPAGEARQERHRPRPGHRRAEGPGDRHGQGGRGCRACTWRRSTCPASRRCGPPPTSRRTPKRWWTSARTAPTSSSTSTGRPRSSGRSPRGGAEVTKMIASRHGRHRRRSRDDQVPHRVSNEDGGRRRAPRSSPRPSGRWSPSCAARCTTTRRRTSAGRSSASPSWAARPCCPGLPERLTERTRRARLPVRPAPAGPRPPHRRAARHARPFPLVGRRLDRPHVGSSLMATTMTPPAAPPAPATAETGPGVASASSPSAPASCPTR